MATISSAGIGSGLDVESLVSKLVSLERTPITQLATKKEGLKTELSAFGKVQSALSALRDAASKLTSPTSWSGTVATSSDPTSVSVTSTSGAPVSNVTVQVAALAQAQTLVGTTYYSGSDATVGQGSLTISLGAWASGNTDFTPKAGADAITINIGPGQDTLAGVRDAINAAGAGVTASIVSDASGTRLSLRSSSTGETNGFMIEGTGGLSDLSYDPRVGNSALTQTVPAQNARALINGIEVSSESNTLKQAIDGLNITLLRTTTFPASVAISQDSEAIKKLITDFTSAYNAVNALLRDQTKYDESTKTAGALQGDSTINSLQSQLRRIIGGTASLGGEFTRLAEIGLEPGSDGNLKVNETKLASAMGNLEGLKTVFMGLDNDEASNSGFAQRLRSYIDGALGTDGSITTRQAGIQKLISNNDKRTEELENRVSLTESRLRARYTALDTQMAKLNSLQEYVTQMTSQLTKNS